jgi:uracil-DNA glycosylase family 4
MQKKVDAFLREIGACTRCYGKKEAIHVPAIMRAPRHEVDLLLIGEQPPRGLGAASLEPSEEIRAFLAEVRINEDRLFYATAVLCTPESEKLRTGRPTPPEVRQCSTHLKRLATLLKPRVIVPLGHTSVQTVQAMFPAWSEVRRFILNYDIGAVLERKGMVVYPLYHPYPATLATRPRSRQLRDWQRIPQLIESGVRAGS